MVPLRLPALLGFLLIAAASCRGDRERELRAWGTVEARQYDVGTRVMGKVLEVLVDEGQTVSIGEPLLRLDLSDLEAQRAQAQAALEAAMAEEQLVVAGARIEDIHSAREAWQASVAQAASAEKEARRMSDLLKSGAVATRTAEDARFASRAASQTAQANESQYRKLLHGSRIEDVEAAKARRSQAEAALAVIESRLVDREISSPVDGIVLLRLVEAGAVALPGVSLLRLGAVFLPYVDVYVPEPDVGDVGVGREVEVLVDAFPDWSFRGRVRFIAEEAEFTPKNIQTAEQRSRLVFRVRVDVFDPEHRLHPGMPVSVRFPLPRGDRR